MSDAIITRRGGGINTSDATMSSINLENGYTGYANDIKVTGSLQVLGGIDVGIAETIDSNSSNIILSGHNLSKAILNTNAPISIQAALSSFGNAVASDVTSGKTFTSAAGVAETGTAAGGASANSYFSLSSPSVSTVNVTTYTTLKHVTVNADSTVTVFYQAYRSSGNAYPGSAELLLNDTVMFTDDISTTSTSTSPDAFTHTIVLNDGDEIKLLMKATMPATVYACKNFNVLINTNLNVTALITDLGSVTL